MRRIFLGLLTAITILSCNTEKDGTTLSGTAEGFDDGTEVYVFIIDENNQAKTVDTVTINQGKFSLALEKTKTPQLNFISVNGTRGNILYFPENKDLTAVVYKDSIQKSYVTGTPMNDAYTNFAKELYRVTGQKQENINEFRTAQREQDQMRMVQIQQENAKLDQSLVQTKRDFIENNKNSLFSVMLISEMLSKKEMRAQEAQKLVASMDASLKDTPLMAQVNQSLEAMKKADVGSKAPNFEAPTPDGESLALNDVLGKYTIIDFWASWCKPCRMENPNVVNVYNKYHDKGLNIISVSLDREGQQDRWVKAIADDNMDWYHVSNLKFWQDPVARQYNVRSIPATFLLDEDGTIIAKNLRGEALQAKMAQLFTE